MPNEEKDVPKKLSRKWTTWRSEVRLGRLAKLRIGKKIARKYNAKKRRGGSK